MKQYTLGVAMTATTPKKVVMVRKNRPDWQAGRINFVGGKVEPEETPIECVSREFYEEAGVMIPVDMWTHFGNMYKTDDWIVHMFFAHSDMVLGCRTMEDEEILLVNVDEIDDSQEFIENIEVILKASMCKDVLYGKSLIHMEYV